MSIEAHIIQKQALNGTIACAQNCSAFCIEKTWHHPTPVPNVYIYPFSRIFFSTVLLTNCQVLKWSLYWCEKKFCLAAYHRAFFLGVASGIEKSFCSEPFFYVKSRNRKVCGQIVESLSRALQFISILVLC